MPPKKKGGNQPSKKSVEKAKDKIVQDKTFGLKNKNKSAKVQKYVQTVNTQVKGNKKGPDRSYEEKKKKEQEKEKQMLEQTLFKSVVQPKVPVGVDPKSIVCEFFKKGLCSKGDKCKYSHDINVSRKSEKIDLYVDRRDIKDEEKSKDTMDNWDQEKLQTVVESKRSEANRQIKTSIVCKYFLEAIEEKKYGWFWECPNGGDLCHYQHCLPPGYVLKKKKDPDEVEPEPTPIEEIIEQERALLTTRTPLTKEIFLKWKEDKIKKQEEAKAAEQAKRESDIKSGKVMRSGREMFVFNPDVFNIDDDDVMDMSELEPDESDDGPVINIDVTGTSITATRKGFGDEENNDGEGNDEGNGKEGEENGKEEEEEDGKEEGVEKNGEEA